MIRRIAGVALIVGVLPYLAPPVYRFPPAHRFTGMSLWNPYADVRGGWRRANFHAHGQAWGGVTSGAQDDSHVVAAYRAAGYDIAGLSDYQRISPLDLVPAYEHGYNVGKHHQLVLGAGAVVWWDFPLWQGLNEKQFVLEQLQAPAALVAINHPARRHGYTPDDVRALTNYDLMEIANGRLRAEDRWDAALSSGRPVLGIGGDDTHDVTDSQRFAVAWTMIAAETLTPGRILDALAAGRAYVVVARPGAAAVPDLRLVSVDVDHMHLTVTLAGSPAGIDFVGQDGMLRQWAVGTVAAYDFAPADSYIRVVIHGPDADVYLNPVIRSWGSRPPMPALQVDGWWTLLRRALLASAALAIALGTRGRRWPVIERSR